MLLQDYDEKLHWVGFLTQINNVLHTLFFKHILGNFPSPDMIPNGHTEMCDSCPDITFWNDQLINSCRMDEYQLFVKLISVAEFSDHEGRNKTVVFAGEHERQIDPEPFEMH